VNEKAEVKSLYDLHAATHLYSLSDTKKPSAPIRKGSTARNEKREYTALAVPLEVMQALNLPPFDHKLTQSGETIFIWDVLRRKPVVLTPEEWVRQHVVHYLINHRGYPKGLLSLERGHHYNQRQKRTDLVALDSNGQPLLLVECKRPTVPITAATAQQAATYNLTIGAPLLLLTNGLTHFCWRVNVAERTNERLSEVPMYGSLTP